MNKSEHLLSSFAEAVFFKDFVFDELCYTPENKTEIELADLVINLEDIIIAIQLKSRNESDQTSDLNKENHWLEKKCKQAKKQAKDTMNLISSGTLPEFKNKRGISISLKPDAKIIPLVVFENSLIENYPHLLRKHSPDSIDVNCMSFEDFEEMCRNLMTPIEIAYYLEYRKDLYEQYGDIDIMLFDDGQDGLLITRASSKETLVHSFLAEKYGFIEPSKQTSSLSLFRGYLHSLPEHTVVSTGTKGSYEIVAFLAHLDRAEICQFVERLEKSIKESRAGSKGLAYSLRRGDNEYAILFVLGGMLDMEYLLSVVRKKADVKRALEVAVYWEDNEHYRIDFHYWEKAEQTGK